MSMTHYGHRVDPIKYRSWTLQGPASALEQWELLSAEVVAREVPWGKGLQSLPSTAPGASTAPRPSALSGREELDLQVQH